MSFFEKTNHENRELMKEIRRICLRISGASDYIMGIKYGLNFMGKCGIIAIKCF